jgi:hypothetical protein
MILSNGEYMSKGKGSISKAHSNEDDVEFWDTNVFSDYWDQAEPVEFEIDIQGEEIHYAIEENLSKRISIVSKRRGISIEALLNLWLQEELQKNPIKPTESDFCPLSRKKYHAIDNRLSDKIRAISKKWNVSATALLNLWLQKKIESDCIEANPLVSDFKSPKSYDIDRELSDKIKILANQRGISPITLVNLYLQKELQKEQEADAPLPKKRSVIEDESQLREKVKALANNQGISIETLMLKWQKIDQQKKLQKQVVQVKASG